MAIGNDEEALKEFLPLGTAADGEEIDQLNEQARAPLACCSDRLDQAAQSGQEAVVPDAQQRPARHIANAGRLHHDRARHAAGEALVPGDHLVGDIAFLGRPPRHHGGNPGPLGEAHRTDVDRRRTDAMPPLPPPTARARSRLVT